MTKVIKNGPSLFDLFISLADFDHTPERAIKFFLEKEEGLRIRVKVPVAIHGLKQLAGPDVYHFHGYGIDLRRHVRGNFDIHTRTGTIQWD